MEIQEIEQLALEFAACLHSRSRELGDVEEVDIAEKPVAEPEPHHCSRLLKNSWFSASQACCPSDLAEEELGERELAFVL